MACSSACIGLRARDSERASARGTALRVAIALMLLQNSRASARVQHGELVLLDDQDRSLWDQAAIEEGVTLLVLTPLSMLSFMHATSMAGKFMAPGVAILDSSISMRWCD